MVGRSGAYGPTLGSILSGWHSRGKMHMIQTYRPVFQSTTVALLTLFVSAAQAQEAPTLLRPSDGTTLTTQEASTTGITFQWIPVADATAYELLLVINGRPLTISDLTESRWGPQAFGSPSGTLIEWSARALVGEAAGPSSATWTLTISDPAAATPTPSITPIPVDTSTPTVTMTTIDVVAAPEPLDPPDGSAFPPSGIAEGIELRWTNVEGAASYRVNIVINNTPRPPIETQQTSAVLQYEAQEDDEIFWAVQAIDHSGIAGSVSVPSRIIVESSLTPTPTPEGGVLQAPALIAPEDGSFLEAVIGETVSVAFEWGSVDGAALYQLLVEQNGTPLELPPLPAVYTTLSVPIEVTEETTILWSVTAVDASGTAGNTSELRRAFLGSPSTPVPTAPPSPTVTPAPADTSTPTVTPTSTITLTPTTTPTASITPTPTPNPADVTGNGLVDVHDVFFMFSRYQLRSGMPGFDPSVDLDGNFRVDSEDVALFIDAYNSR